MTRAPILDVKQLKTHFRTDDGLVKAVDGVSFTVAPGEAVGIVGESGSGKSVTNMSLLRLIPTPPGIIAGGEVLFHGQDLLRVADDEIRRVRGKRIAMIFQDPMTSLNPFLKIGRQMTEVTETHEGLAPAAARARAIEFLERVGIPSPEGRIDQYPHQFSGGMRQRVMIAMALSTHPEILIADEPTTALDVTIQAQILDLIAGMRRDLGMALVLITHDLGVVAGICERVLVMYAGRIVEEAPVRELFARPRHPYTQGLLRSVPRLDGEKAARSTRLPTIPGQPPDLLRLPGGCAFAPRCPHRQDRCLAEEPALRTVGEGRRTACHFDV